MACHTWCYAHIPSEANKWAQEYKTVFKKEMERISRLSNISDEQRVEMNELLETVESLPLEEIPKFLDERQTTMQDYSLLFAIICMGYDFGNFTVFDGKIYREVDTYNGNDTEIKERWPFKNAYHDIFRIYDYDAPPCHSLEETLKRCEEYKVDWNLHEWGSYLVNNKKKIYDFWEKYPDGIIEFGR